MYNFVDSKLLPKVTTQTSCMEGFEVSNLINPDYMLKSRGFIAYTTMKPPVDVDFELICSVNLSHIVINTTNGKQKTSGLEIFVKTPHSSYVSICKTFFNEDGIILCNARNYSRRKRPNNTNPDYILVFFKSNEFRSFLNASSIRIRILKTDSCSPPCLGGVQIWGRVSKTCSNVTIDTLNKLLNRTNHFEKVSKTGVSNLNVTFEIPEEFNDELTYEVMSLPMTLPSGHNVDQSTLDKCISTDAACGRQPSDPFTGLRFCANRKPILNVALKTRIDMFLMQNSHREETFSVKRTLGRAKKYEETKSGDVSSYSEIFGSAKKIKLEISENLDDAITKVMNNGTFMRFTGNNVVENEKHKCCVKCSKNDVMYIIPCKHIYCRKCLFEIDNTCDICSAKFAKNEPQRYHR